MLKTVKSAYLISFVRQFCIYAIEFNTMFFTDILFIGCDVNYTGITQTPNEGDCRNFALLQSKIS